MDKFEAIKKIIGMWGLAEHSRLDGIKAIVNERSNPETALAYCEKIRDAIAALYNLAEPR